MYEGKLTRHVKFAKVFSLTTSVVSCGLQGVLVGNDAIGSLLVKIVLGSFLGSFIIMTPLLMHWITKRYVTHMFYEKETHVFTAFTLNLFLQKKMVTFKPCDVEIPDGTGFLYTVKVLDKPLFFDEQSFKDKEALIKMMRYDEPIDLS